MSLRGTKQSKNRLNFFQTLKSLTRKPLQTNTSQLSQKYILCDIGKTAGNFLLFIFMLIVRRGLILGLFSLPRFIFFTDFLGLLRTSQ
jgi:hypothetical protein